MRPVLIRLLLDHPWRLFEPDVKGVEAVGIALFTCVLGLTWCAWTLWRRGRDWTADDKSMAGSWLTAVVLLSFAPPLLIDTITARFATPDPATGIVEPIRSLPIFGYGFFVLVAFLSATALGQWRAKREGLNHEFVFDVTFWTLIFGVLGGRLFHLIQYRAYVYKDVRGVGDFLFRSINLSSGGLVLIGAMLGAAVGFFILCRLRGMKPLPLLDLLTPSIFLAVGFGRIGCLMYGCCYGDPSSLPWAVTFGPESAAYDALVSQGYLLKDAPACMPLHPTQLYSAINAFLLCLLTYAWYPWRERAGQVFALGLILYPISRFVIEILRADESTQFGTGLTISQLLSIGLCIGGLLLAWWVRSHGALLRHAADGSR
ncbi:MAG: prolipoprotein diacylglyceryl transferase [Planctomycetaceae bacterium]